MARTLPAWSYSLLTTGIQGDVLHFGMAVEKARASGLTVEMLIVGDDVGVGRKQSGKVGRRGLAGTVLVHKIAGAMAARGYGDHSPYFCRC